VPFVDEKNVGLISGVVGAGGNLGGMAFGFLFKSENITYSQAFTYIGVTIVLAAGIVALVKWTKSEAVATTPATA
jgi:NNP family nitrate/nitrite transporter-like MFS transporter